MPLIILIWGIYYFIYGAVINVYNGFGYDGILYADLVKNFNFLVFFQKVDSYLIQRIFPSFIVHIFLTIFKISKDNNFYIVTTFHLYNLILIMLCSFLWYRISKFYKLNLKATWLGFIIGFVNFGIAKMPFYYPVQTDITAFFLGFCLLYFHVKNNLIGKIIITILGAFTWPSFIYFGILLIIFPLNSGKGIEVKSEKSGFKYLALLLPLPFFILSIYDISDFFRIAKLQDKVSTMVIPAFLYISSLFNYLVMVYFFYVFLPNKLIFSKYFQFLKKIFFNIKKKYVLSCILIFVTIYITQKSLSSEPNTGNVLIKVIYSISFYSCAKPFAYFLTSITYFGPAFIILIFYLKNYKIHLKNLGIGVYISFVLFFVLLFSTESRKIINFFPFIILLTVLVIKDFNIQKNLFIFITIFSFILSQVYISLSNVPTSDIITKNYYQFPDQLFFMNTFMISNNSYYIQMPIVILMIVCILFIIKKNKQNQVQAADI